MGKDPSTGPGTEDIFKDSCEEGRGPEKQLPKHRAKEA